MNVWSTILKTIRKHERCAMITVARAQGSAPREAGARIVVQPNGGFYGTIGGGTLEYEAINHAINTLAQKEFDVRLTRHVLGPDLGQCCGGVVQLLTECFDQSRLAELESLSDQEANGQFYTVGEIQKDRVFRKIKESQYEVKQQLFALQDDGRVYETFGSNKRALYLFGAGHVGRSVVLALAQLDFRVVWVDSRADQFPAAAPSNVQPCFIEQPAEILQAAPDGAFVVVMTHSHSLDLEIVHEALSLSRFTYVGLIGSASKRTKFSKRLKEAGVSSTQLAQLVCPIGIKGIDSKQPAAIAASLAAQLIIEDEKVRSETSREFDEQIALSKSHRHSRVGGNPVQI